MDVVRCIIPIGNVMGSQSKAVMQSALLSHLAASAHTSVDGNMYVVWQKHF